MKRRAYLSHVAGGTALFLGGIGAATAEQQDDSIARAGLRVRGQAESDEGSAEVTCLGRLIVIDGVVPVSDGCQTAELEDVTVAEDGVTVTIGETRAEDAGDVCTEAIVGLDYGAKVVLREAVDTVTVVHDTPSGGTVEHECEDRERGARSGRGADWGRSDGNRSEHDFDFNRSERDFEFNRSEHDFDFNRSEHDFDFNRSEHDFDFNKSEHDFDFNRSEHDFDFNRSESDFDFNRSERDFDFNRSESDFDFNRSEGDSPWSRGDADRDFDVNRSERDFDRNWSDAFDRNRSGDFGYGSDDDRSDSSSWWSLGDDSDGSSWFGGDDESDDGGWLGGLFG